MSDGTSICGGGAVYTFNTSLLFRYRSFKRLVEFWQLSEPVELPYWSLHPLLCSHLHFLVSYWCPRVCRCFETDSCSKSLYLISLVQSSAVLSLLCVSSWKFLAKSINRLIYLQSNFNKHDTYFQAQWIVYLGSTTHHRLAFPVTEELSLVREKQRFRLKMTRGNLNESGLKRVGGSGIFE
ncbi:hypothetical protein D5086_002880 [Populus alba]|uniref:Uncharacterized protein n=1 Tax=Populus alba TaxID=43335 RepID=A0ACC4D3Z2_POPAL